MRPRSPRLPSSVVSTSSTPSARRNRGRRARRRVGRRRRASSARRARASASASIANGARPTPPATIHAVRRWIDERERAAERTEAGDVSPGSRVDRAACRDADALVQERDAGGPADRDRAAPRRPKRGGAAAGRGPVAAFTMTNWPGCAAARNRRRRQREHVVVGRQRRVGDHGRRHDRRASGQYTACVRALPSHAEQRDRRRRAGRRATSSILVLQLNPHLPLHPIRLVPLALAIGPFYARI